MASILRVFADDDKSLIYRSTKSAIIGHFRSNGDKNWTLMSEIEIDGGLATENDTWWRQSTTTAWNATAEAEFDVDDYLQRQLGRRYRDLGESVALIIVYCVIFLTGVVGKNATKKRRQTSAL